MHPTLRTVALAALIAAPGMARADEALVAVAANFAGAVEAIGAEFAKDTGHTIQVTTGATGKLYAQISEGAPFDVLLSADIKTPAQLQDEGTAVLGTSFTYAVGMLSVWSADSDRIGADPKAALTAPETLHVAIANPDLAPYGVAAREALTAMGLWETIQPKIVMGENIGQTFSMVDTGAAQMGFIATSAIESPGSAPKGSRYDVPQALFTPIKQDAVLLKAGDGNAAAIAFLDYLKGDKAKAIIASFGYGTE
ncbi:molybdate ABC transporter substrate-binding protein [Dongia deserti]|uniref:molybdate ABC transporter substrate-binding protein n=1 Tax=Dongia deserti TaxID=2268030 RepID=UPI000E6597F4|nr:molybdate ABC transporter substrate-binding protein [Dongia deserti]